MDERLCQLDPLSHAPAVRTNFLVGGVGEIDEFERTRCGLACLRLVETVEPDERGDPLQPGHALVKGILFRTEAHTKKQSRISPDRFAEYCERPLTRCQLTGNQLEKRRLASPIGTKEAGNARWQLQRDIVQPDDLTVPLRNM